MAEVPTEKMEKLSVDEAAPARKSGGAAEKAAAKAARQAAAAAATAAAAAAAASLKSAICNPDTDLFGNYPLIQSQTLPSRTWTDLSEINASLDGQLVWIRARVFSTRGKGNGAFVVLRQKFNTVQATVFKTDDLGISKEFVKFASQVNRESVVDIQAVVAKATVESCTQKDAELQVRRFYVVSASAEILPFQVEDAARPEKEFERTDTKFVRVNQDTRLDSRWIDLRTPANQAIFRVQSMVGLLFREFLITNGFIEIHTPKLLGASSEGGASVFRLSYFDRPACLAQSPQLYKQMAVVSDMDRVFEIGPVFRAENSNTHRHLCEFVGLDMEMAFKEHYYEVLDVIDGMFRYIFDGLHTRCQSELAAINAQYPFNPLRYRKDKTLRIPYSEGIALLRAAGQTIGDLDDINTEQERLLGDLIVEKYGVDFYIMDKFPADARPFYTMPDPVDPRYTNSYDIYVRGEEIVSGSQRIHDPELLTVRAKAKGMNPDDLKSYIDSFRHGAPPHGGCGVGLERVTMLFLGLDNIRKTSMFPRDPRRCTP